MAFRWRLIVPPAPWVAGEWFTLLLLTLPFALAVIAFCLLRWRRGLALMAAAVPIPIIAALLLSCSRAVFWAVVVLRTNGDRTNGDSNQLPRFRQRQCRQSLRRPTRRAWAQIPP